MGFLASTVRLLAAILKPVKLGFQNIVTFRFYPWVILRKNFLQNWLARRATARLFLERETAKN